jgi:transposase
LDLSAIEHTYGGRGSLAYPPKLMVALLFYGYATGVFSSRKLERASLRVGAVHIYGWEPAPGSGQH